MVPSRCTSSVKLLVRTMALLLLFCFGFLVPSVAAANVKVLLLLGDSNSVGRGDIGQLSELVYEDNLYPFLRTDLGRGFAAHPSVRITFNYDTFRSSPLVVGYETQFAGPDDTPVFGPEVGIGWTIADSFPNENILIVKVAERGNKQVYDWLPPGLQNQNDPDSGFYWNLMIDMLNDVFANTNNYVSNFQPQVDTVEVAGIFSFMGWNDAFDNDNRPMFESSMEAFIDELRANFGSDIPIIVGELGQQGAPARFSNVEEIRQGGENVVNLFRNGRGDDMVCFVPTNQFVIADQEIFHNEAHFWGRADTFMNIGIALGQELLDKVISPTAAPTEAPITAAPIDPPTEVPVTAAPTEPPTEAPVTAAPTPEPTDAPVTIAPIEAPAASPVTNAPTPEPTEAPITSAPVDSPTTEAPVSSTPLTTPEPTIPPLITPTDSPVVPSTDSPVAPAATTVQVFLLLGDGAMCRGNVDHLTQIVNAPGSPYDFLQSSDGAFASRSDVKVTTRTTDPAYQVSDLVVGFGSESAGPNGVPVFGIDIGFGHEMGNAIDDPILLVKMCGIGSKLNREWASTTSTCQREDSNPDTAILWDEMVAQVDAIKADIATYFPDIDGDIQAEVSGVVASIGWNDAADDATRSCFQIDLFALVRDLQRLYGEFIPIAVTELGQQGAPASDPDFEEVRLGQVQVVNFQNGIMSIPTTKFVETAPFQNADESFDTEQYFYGNAQTYMDIGKAAAETMLAAIEEKPTTPSPTPAPTEAPAGGGGIVICFSGETTVMTRTRGEILMKDLKLGEEVAVSHNDDFEKVYSFGHVQHETLANYLRITPSQLEISVDHMIVLDGGATIPASMLQVGDRLFGGTAVTAIDSVKRRGAYAPFTFSGKLLVNGVLVSNYVAFQQSQHVQILDISTNISYQWLAHAYQAPHRLWCTYMSECLTESYTTTGISTWVSQPLQVILWLREQRWAVTMTGVLAIFAAATVAVAVVAAVAKRRHLIVKIKTL